MKDSTINNSNNNHLMRLNIFHFNFAVSLVLLSLLVIANVGPLLAQQTLYSETSVTFFEEDDNKIVSVKIGPIGTSSHNCTSCSSSTETYFEDFECNDKRDHWGLTFADPTNFTSGEYYISNVTVLFWGMSPCPQADDNCKSTAIFLFHSNFINLGTFELGSCPNCGSMSSVVPALPGTWAYTYGGNNNVSLLMEADTQVCLNQVIVNLTFTPERQVIGYVYPISGPSSGGTLVTVSGSQFYQSADLLCIFGNQTVNATFVSSKSITCVSPPANGVIGQSQTFGISENNQVIVNPHYNFTYYDEPSLFYLTPSHGTPGGQEHITIFGSGFINDPNMVCSFGVFGTSQAQFNNASSIWCPSKPCKSPNCNGVSVYVDVAINGAQFTNSQALVFTYADQVPPPLPSDDDSTSVHPTMLFWEICATVAAAILLVIFVIMFALSQRLHGNRDDERALLYSRNAPEPKDNSTIDISEIQIMEKIEKGSFGEIFKASWRGTIVALKKIPSANLTSQLIKELKREAALMKSLRHPNVLQFLGTTTDPRDNDFVIMMEFMPKGSLYRLIHNPSIELSPKRIRDILIDAARGMNYLHNLNPPIIHRDLKSHNLLVDSHWKVKVCDFGLSKMIEEANAQMTACGTPAWTAPEVLRNERYTAKADVYSFGIVTWELFSREDPFPGTPPFQVVFIVGNQGRRPPIQNHWPAEWIQLITECWNENAADRPSFGEIIEKLSTM